MRHQHVNMAEIEAAIEQMKQAMLPLTKENGSVGAQARMSIAVSIEFQRQLGLEINLGTSTEHVSDAVAAVCSNMIGSLAESVVGSEKAELVGAINRQLLKTSRFLSQRFTGEAKEVFASDVAVQTGGTA